MQRLQRGTDRMSAGADLGQGRILRELKFQEKVRVRALYEEMFPEDEEAFVDAYDQYKSAHNRILAIQEKDEPIAMLHLNPYRFWIRGRVVDSSYIVAVATKPAYRRQGCMRSLLRGALQDLYEKKQPFVFLMPAKEAIYTPFDFRMMKNEDGEIWANASMEELKEQFEVFVWKDKDYKQQHIPDVEWETTPMMVRIVHLQELLKYVGADTEEPICLRIKIEDPILQENTGIYDWVLNQSGSCLIPAEEERELDLQAAIADLGSFLFGAESVETIFPNVSSEIREKLEQVKVFRKIFINEVV